MNRIFELHTHKKSHILPWTVLPVVAVLLRFFSFFPYVVIDHDESTYIVIGDQLLDGAVYLRDVMDTKPIGIFWIHAALLWIGGKSIFFIRFVVALLIGFSSSLIYNISFKSTGNKIAAWLSGVIYILITSTFTRWGISPNTELYFNFFCLCAIYLSLFNQHYSKDFAAGICLGIAFHIKYVVAADTAALGIFIFYQAVKNKSFFNEGIKRLFIMFIGFLIPLIAVISYFIYHSQWQTFRELTFDVTNKYSTPVSLATRLLFFKDYFLQFLPVSILVVITVTNREFKNHRLFLFFILWFLFVSIIISIPGKHFNHYFIHLMPVSSLLAGFYFSTRPGINLWNKYLINKWKIICACLFVVLSFFELKDYVLKEDKVKAIAAELTKTVTEQDNIYTGNAPQILYFILDKKPPTKFVHSTLLWYREHRNTLDIDLDKELENILQKSPKYLLLTEPVPDENFKNKLLGHFFFVKNLPGGANLYQLNAAP